MSNRQAGPKSRTFQPPCRTLANRTPRNASARQTPTHQTAAQNHARHRNSGQTPQTSALRIKKPFGGGGELGVGMNKRGYWGVAVTAGSPVISE
ncbi:MAG: hypothetical protein RLZZ436_4631 [Planctomycetota bacterium]|jgi:hypothetical protein